MREKRVQGRYARTGEGSMITAPEFEPIENVHPSLNGSKPAEDKTRYTIRNAAFALQPWEPLDYVLENLITEGSLSVFYGEPGSKKTYSLLSLAVCVALQKEWLGFTTRGKRVLIIDEESGERRLSIRLGEAIRGELGDERTPIDFVSLAGFHLDNKGDQLLLQALIEEQGAGLVIIDALADVMNGDENSKQDTQPIFTALRRIAAATSAAIIVIHHSNKSGGYRGSSAIKGAVDVMVCVESTNGSNRIRFKCEKNRDSSPREWAAMATWAAGQFYLSETEAKEAGGVNKSERYVLRYLTENGASPLPDIRGAADSCSPKAAELAVYSLVDKGFIYRTNPHEKGRGAAAIYDLTQGGRALNE